MDPLDFSHLDTTSLAGQIAHILSQNPQITGVVGNRILDYDPRTAGWDLTPDNVEVFTLDKRIMTTIVVDDEGGAPVLGAPTQSYSDTVYIWVLSGATINAAREVPVLMRWMRKQLRYVQLPDKSMLAWRLTTGPTPTEDGWMGRMTYSVNGIN